MSDQPSDGEKFFEEHGYYPTKFVERKPTAVNSDAESQFGPFFSSASARCFHRLGCPWLRYIPKRNRIKYASHLEARQAGKKPCKNGCAS